MWNSLRLEPNPNRQSRHGGRTNVSRGLIGIWSCVIGHWLSPNVVWAHGDDDVTEVTFLGPLILVAVLAVGMSVGRPLVRWLARRG